MENNNYLAIRDWREDERPREKLERHGPHTLSDAELIAILIRTGTKQKSAVDLARELLNKYDGINGLIQKDLNQLRQIKGIGTAKAIELAAAFELNKRMEQAPYSDKKVIKTPEDVANYYIGRLRGLQHEEFRILLLNSANHVIKEILISKGTLNASIIHPREVFFHAIIEKSASIILLHNHPSGNPNPSKEDNLITSQLVEAGKFLDIKIVDHIIIAGDEFYSYAKKGII